METLKPLNFALSARPIVVCRVTGPENRSSGKHLDHDATDRSSGPSHHCILCLKLGANIFNGGSLVPTARVSISLATLA